MPNAAMPDKTPEVFAYLKQCAFAKRTATYTEIGDAVGLDRNKLAGQLNYISTQVCRENGLPCLAALAVSAITGMPSQGWIPGAAVFGSAGYPLFWCSIINQVFATDWSKIEIENPA